MLYLFKNMEGIFFFNLDAMKFTWFLWDSDTQAWWADNCPMVVFVDPVNTFGSPSRETRLAEP